MAPACSGGRERVMSLGVLLSQTGSVGIKSQYTMLILFVYYIYYLTGRPTTAALTPGVVTVAPASCIESLSDCGQHSGRVLSVSQKS